MPTDAYRAACRRTPGGVTGRSSWRRTRLAVDPGYGDDMPAMRWMRQAPGPLLIDGLTALAVVALLAQQLLTRPPLPGQHPTTILTWLVGAVSIVPILTHRRFPRTSVAVCLSAVAI